VVDEEVQLSSLIDRAREMMGIPNYKLYQVNDVDSGVNAIAIKRIKKARAVFEGVGIDKKIGRAYERDMLTTLPSVEFDRSLFNDIRKRAVAALSDRDLSPCQFASGELADRQGIPREAIAQDIRCWTSDVEAVIPDAPALIDDRFVHAIQSCIGSNFRLIGIDLTRNHHIPDELSAKYDLLSDRWHFDHKYLDIFFMFVCLSEVTLDDGPTHALSAPDSRALLDMGFDCAVRERDPNGGLSPKIIESMGSLTVCAGPPGTKLMSHTTLCLHKGGGAPPKGQVRDIALFRFQHSNEMDLSWESVKRAA
jgi:hypothetical protein